ncbi:cingulin-like isoform X2 [Myxocyprinus asiaticus]|uniref:cingulin-like isoform X2 n=1 Tax=Myxocyprinus asiaticus TaxID=70543 RepID=UPI0022224AA5|nr:cingulin-like isoform X2 [Myxocyprinus asiaticus]
MERYGQSAQELQACQLELGTAVRQRCNDCRTAKAAPGRPGTRRGGVSKAEGSQSRRRTAGSSKAVCPERTGYPDERRPAKTVRGRSSAGTREDPKQDGRDRDIRQELARQQEKAQLLEGGQCLAQEQLTEHVAEVVQAEKAQRRLQAEHKRLTEKLENTKRELQDSWLLVERVKAEASSCRQELLKAQQEKQQIQEELASSRENLSALQTKNRLDPTPFLLCVRLHCYVSLSDDD